MQIKCRKRKFLLRKNEFNEDDNFSWIKKDFSTNYKEIYLKRRKTTLKRD